MPVRRLTGFALLLVVLAARPDAGVPGRSQGGGQAATPAATLTPTVHSTLPATGRLLWLVPESGAETQVSPAMAAFAAGVRALEEGRAAEALERFSTTDLDGTALADYVRHYRARALAALERHEEALAVTRDLRGRRPAGALDEAARWHEAETLAQLERFAEAQAAYRDLTAGPGARLEEGLGRLASVAEQAGDREAALAAWKRLLYEIPLGDGQGEALRTLTRAGVRALNPTAAEDRVAARARAQALYDARRWADARQAYEALRPSLAGADRNEADLRIAVSLAETRRYRTRGRDRLASLIQRGALEAEARYHHANVLRDLGATRTFVTRVRTLVDTFPNSPWAERALDELGTYYVRRDEDAQALDVFRELYRRFPTGARAERAAWKIGWAAYRDGDWNETVRVFEAAARDFPRANTRPAWLYWAARAHEQLGHAAVAAERYRLTATDYLHSYYGQQASRRLGLDLEKAAATLPGRPAAPPSEAGDILLLPPAHALVRLLLSLGLYDDARREVEHLIRVEGRSPALLATLAWIEHRTGNLLRGTQTIKQAYPQYLAAGGEELPVELLRVVFPLAHFDLIREHAAANGLDPYVVAALIAQESGYDEQARSAANAYGLMQILPSTGRQLARRLGIPRFRTAMLTDPAINIRMGTHYFAGLVEAFDGQVHLALAAYNAGTSRARAWTAEKPGLERDVFIDDIPFPETQGYVKRVLGLVENYRRLY